MRAVNLLPPDLRRAAASVAPAALREKAEGIGAYVVLGALALCVAALAAYVMTTNTVKQKQADLEQVTAEASAAAQEVAKLKPYADFDAMAKARVETVRGLAAARFDWEQALRELSLAMPSDAKLQGLTGDMLHGLTTLPGMLSVVCCAIAGALAAVVLLVLTHDGTLAFAGAAVVFLGMFLAMASIAMRAVAQFQRTFVAKFPPPTDPPPDR